MTTSFTPGQRGEVDVIIRDLCDIVAATINRETPRILAMDSRPRKAYSPEEPNVYFPYVNQAILEDLIEELKTMV